MILTPSIRWTLTAAVLAWLSPFAAAHAEQQKPTVVLVHRNVHKAIDEEHWQDVANLLAGDGYRVVSLAAPADATVAQGSRMLVDALHQERPDSQFVIVSTAAASEVASAAAQAEMTHVRALVYISAEDTVATLGPRTVSEPAALHGIIPSYQVRITARRRIDFNAERGAGSAILVREDGQSTLARMSDLVGAIETISTQRQSA